MPSSLLLFGCDFFPDRMTSEINFWYELVRHFERSFDEIVIVSVNNGPQARQRLSERVTLYNVAPYYWGNRKNWSNPHYTGKRFHKLPFAIAYKTVTFLQHLNLISELIRTHNIDVVHYMRVFGLFNGLLVRRHPAIAFTMTVPTHVDRGFPLHHFYHWIKKAGFRGMDRLVPTSRATLNKLRLLGFPPETLEVIHWSSGDYGTAQQPAEHSDIRDHLGISRDSRLVLWSGPLQGTGEAEYLYSLEVAKSVIRRSDRYHFVFAFKPDALKEHYRDLASDIQGTTVLESNHTVFNQLQKESSLFLSPVCNLNRTVAPALTWIEMMQNGVPVITTPVDGVEELISHGHSGFVVNEPLSAAELLLSLNDADMIQIGKSGQQVVEEHYDLSAIARAYEQLWADILQKKQRKVDR